MANLSKDIQCASLDTRPPMLVRTDFASWQQRIRLYSKGKENKMNILKSIDERPFQMGTFRETLFEGNEGALHLGPDDLGSILTYHLKRKKELHQVQGTKPQFKTTGLLFRMFRVDRLKVRGTMHGVEVQLVMGELRTKLGMEVQMKSICYLLHVDKTMLLKLNVDNVFQADDCDAFDSDVNEAPSAQTMFMENLSSTNPVYDKAGPSYDSDILSEVHDHDHYRDAVCEHHEVHEMHDDVQPNYVVDSHVDYTSDNNMILYDQYVKDNAVPVVQSSKQSNTIRELREKISQLTKKNSDADPIHDLKALDSQNKELHASQFPSRSQSNMDVHLDYLKHLKKSVATLRKIVEEARFEKPLDCLLASACRYTKHSQESVEYVIGTCPTNFNKGDKHIASTPVTRKKRITFMDQCETSTNNILTHVKQQTLNKTNEPVIPSTGVKGATATSGSKPRSNTNKDTTLPAKSDMNKVEVHPRNNKTSVKRKNHVDSSISCKRTVISSNSNSVCKACNKCLMYVSHDNCVVKSVKSVTKSLVHKVWQIKRVMQVWQETAKLFVTVGDHSRLRNFVKKFIGIVRFENDHFGAIMGYGDYVIGDSVIFRKLHSGSIHVMFKIRMDLKIFHQKSVLKTPQQNDVVKRRNRTLVEAARRMLIFSKALIFLWAEVVATACYTQNWSLIHTRHNKTPYELVHDKKHDLTFFCDFGAFCYPINNSEDLGKLQPTTDIIIFVGYAPSRKGYRIYNKRTRCIMETIHVQFDELSEPMAPMQLSTGPTPPFLTLGQISSGLIPNLVPAAPYVPSTNKDLEILFQPMFDEYLEPPRVKIPISPASAVPVPFNSTDTPSSTTIDQDAPSLSHSSSSSALQSLSLQEIIAAESTIMEDNPLAPVDNDLFVNVFASEPSSEASSSRDKKSMLVNQRVSLSGPSDTCLSFEEGSVWFKACFSGMIKMVDEKVPAPTRSDDQILPFVAWVPIKKSNFVLDLHKKQKNLIFQISVDILQTTNFFRAFTASASRDETRFVLDANLLRDPLEITPIDQAHQFVSPPSGDIIMDFVNQLGYTEVIYFLSRMAVNNLYQPWRAILSMINQCLTGKTSGHDRLRYPLKPVKEESAKSTPPQQAGKGKITKVHKVKSPFQLVDEPDEEPSQSEHEPKLEHQGKGDEDDMERAIQMSDASENTNSEGDTEILQIDEEQGNDVHKQVNLEEKTDELDQGQVGSDPELAARVTSLEKKLSNLEQKNKTLDNTSRNLGSRVFTLELRDLPYKINEVVHESVREAIRVALQAPLQDCFRELPEADMKEILHQRMFKTGTYKSLPEHVALYEALEASMEWANMDKLLTKKDKSRKRQRNDQDPPPPPPYSKLSKRRRHDTGASGSS
uniref:Integrase catalytic domain-containing protein n=1 Tax=Tanacetum cinerariifolium TaxID=118510 RepID=A0A699GP79_TANCI|nr:hypothetical protein [Tanacetum cinerariifolium]